MSSGIIDLEHFLKSVNMNELEAHLGENGNKSLLTKLG